MISPANAVMLFPGVTDKFTSSNRFQNHGWVASREAFDVVTLQAPAPDNPEGKRTGYKAVLVYRTLPIKEDAQIAAVGAYAATLPGALEQLLEGLMVGMRALEGRVARFLDERPSSKPGRFVMDIQLAMAKRTIMLD